VDELTFLFPFSSGILPESYLTSAYAPVITKNSSVCSSALSFLKSFFVFVMLLLLFWKNSLEYFYTVVSLVAVFSVKTLS
jgi:hypothetical protein